MLDVAVIGAGISGLVCAQQLRFAGYKVVVVEKSRGLGGRVATRRLYGTCADHGACYLKPRGELLGRFVQLLCDRGVLQVWTDTIYEYSHYEGSHKQIESTNPYPRYVASAGMSAIAKFLAPGLEIWLNQRVEALNVASDRCLWHLTLQSNSNSTATKSPELTAKAVVMAIPAPQAVILLQPLNDQLPALFLGRLGYVEFDPCLSVMAGYSAQLHQPPDWKAITFVDDSELGWVSLDSSKRMEAGQSLVFVLQSSANFARRRLEVKDIQPIGNQLLLRAAEYLLPWLNQPEWMQVHRWRYAFPSRPLAIPCLSAETPLPLVCCGDWCGGNQVEDAMQSGIAAAEQINRQLDGRSLPGNDFFDLLG
jgi:hypothetical protein